MGRRPWRPGKWKSLIVRLSGSVRFQRTPASRSRHPARSTSRTERSTAPRLTGLVRPRQLCPLVFAHPSRYRPAEKKPNDVDVRIYGLDIDDSYPLYGALVVAPLTDPPTIVPKLPRMTHWAGAAVGVRGFECALGSSESGPRSPDSSVDWSRSKGRMAEIARPSDRCPTEKGIGHDRRPRRSHVDRRAERLGEDAPARAGTRRGHGPSLEPVKERP